VEVGPLEVGPLEVGAAEVGPLEVGAVEDGFLEVGLLELGAEEVGPLKVGLSALFTIGLKPLLMLREDALQLRLRHLFVLRLLGSARFLRFFRPIGHQL
jgi:hypothetical protein